MLRLLVSSLIVLILSSSSICSASEYWVYVRLEDRAGVSKSDDVGRSKKGDVIDIRPVTKTSTPGDKAKKEWMIFKAELNDTQVSNMLLAWNETVDDIITSKAYRRNKLDLTQFEDAAAGLTSTVVSQDKIKIVEKTTLDLARYERNRIMYLAKRPFLKLANWIIPKATAETISTINKTGEDYDTITLWEDAVDGDLVTDTRQETAECYDDDGDLTDNPVIDGSTTNSSYYLKITSPSSDRHDGTISNGFRVKYSAPSGGNGTFKVLDNNTIVEWLIIQLNSVTNYDDGTFGITISNVDNVYIRNNIVVYEGTGHNGADYGRGIYVCNNVDLSYTYYILNNMILGFDNRPNTSNWYGLSSGCGGIDDTWTVYAYNNTAYGNYEGMSFSNGHAAADAYYYVQNNVSVGNAVDFAFSGDSTFTENDYNCSEDSSATGSNSLTTCSDSDFESVTAGSEDLHLASGAVPIDEGNDKGTTPTGVNFDIDNRDRDSEGDTWDMGADERVSSAPPASQGTFLDGVTATGVIISKKAIKNRLFL